MLVTTKEAALYSAEILGMIFFLFLTLPKQRTDKVEEQEEPQEG